MKQDDRQLIRSKVMQSIDMSGDIGDEQVSDMIDRCILESESGNVLSVRDKLALKKELFNSLRRLDILSELLDDEAVTEIMINGYSNIFVERAGRMYRYDKAFESEERLKTIIQSIVAECNRIVNEASPIVDARLKDGSRVNVVLPPVSLSGSVMTSTAVGTNINCSICGMIFFAAFSIQLATKTASRMGSRVWE